MAAQRQRRAAQKVPELVNAWNASLIHRFPGLHLVPPIRVRDLPRIVRCLGWPLAVFRQCWRSADGSGTHAVAQQMPSSSNFVEFFLVADNRHSYNLDCQVPDAAFCRLRRTDFARSGCADPLLPNGGPYGQFLHRVAAASVSRFGNWD